jgi:hypothetical protein
MLHIDQREFLLKCVDVLNRFGHDDSAYLLLGKERECRVYEDSVILIAKSNDDRWMEMIRKYNDNPFYWMDDGETIRFNSDFVYLEEHIEKLLRSI